MSNVNWEALMYEILYRFEREHQEPEPLRDASMNLHPENFADFMRYLPPTSFQFTAPPMYFGMRFIDNVLVPVGVAMVIQHDKLVATANLDDKQTLLVTNLDAMKGKVRRIR